MYVSYVHIHISIKSFRRLTGAAREKAAGCNCLLAYGPCEVVYANVGKARHPFLSVVDFAAYLLGSGVYAYKLLAGFSLQQSAQWQDAFSSFWKSFQQLEPSHEIFELHQNRLQFCVPVLLHGDEGTSYGKKGLFEYSWSPLLTVGGSGPSRYFMISQIPYKYYGKLSKGNEKGNAALDRVMTAGVDSMLQCFVNGIEIRGTQDRLFLVPLGLTGDHVFHAMLVSAQHVCTHSFRVKLHRHATTWDNPVDGRCKKYLGCMHISTYIHTRAL